MKTFKLVALDIITPNQRGESHEHVELSDGLIINKEDGGKQWIIEALVPKAYTSYFQELSKQQNELKLQVIISQKNNDPATFSAKIIAITEMEQHVSVLLSGLLLESKTNTAEIILAQLIEQGLSGDVLLKEFRQRLYEKRKTRSSFK